MPAAYAVRIPGDPNIYRALSLVEDDAVTLLMEADSLSGVVPHPGDSVTWASSHYTVRAVDTLAPDGTPILHTVVASL